MGRFDDEAAAVTGAASGIGEASVRRFATGGAAVSVETHTGRESGERRVAAAGRTAEAFRAEFGRGTMLWRRRMPAEVAACILFPASDHAAYVTGASLYVDSGQTAR